MGISNQVDKVPHHDAFECQFWIDIFFILKHTHGSREQTYDIVNSFFFGLVRSLKLVVGELVGDEVPAIHEVDAGLLDVVRPNSGLYEPRRF